MSEETDEELGESTHFNFEHKVFSIEGCYFAADSAGDKARFIMPMGEEMATMAVKDLSIEFSIENESSDGKLLEIVIKSLKYVHQIRPNDSIPKEVLDGSASWSVEDRHRAAAHNRVKIQLATLMTGKEDQIIDAEQMEMLVDDPETQKRVKQAFGLVADKLGLPPEKKQEVVAMIEQLGHELAFIEGLRERFQAITSIQPKVERLLKKYGNQTGTGEDLDRIRILLGDAVMDIETVFDIVDAQTCEIMTVLKSFEIHIEHIRDARDDLHRRFMNWNDVVDPWQEEEGIERSNEIEQVVKKTYKQLAQMFPQTQSWAMVGQ